MTAKGDDQSIASAMLSAIQQHFFDNNAINTGWVLVSEWLEPEGEYSVVTLTDMQSPPWRQVGLLAKASFDLESELAQPSSEDEEDEG